MRERRDRFPRGSGLQRGAAFSWGPAPQGRASPSTRARPSRPASGQPLHMARPLAPGRPLRAGSALLSARLAPPRCPDPSVPGRPSAPRCPSARARPKRRARPLRAAQPEWDDNRRQHLHRPGGRAQAGPLIRRPPRGRPPGLLIPRTPSATPFEALDEAREGGAFGGGEFDALRGGDGLARYPWASRADGSQRRGGARGGGLGAPCPTYSARTAGEPNGPGDRRRYQGGHPDLLHDRYVLRHGFSRPHSTGPMRGKTDSFSRSDASPTSLLPRFAPSHAHSRLLALSRPPPHGTPKGPCLAARALPVRPGVRAGGWRRSVSFTPPRRSRCRAPASSVRAGRASRSGGCAPG